MFIPQLPTKTNLPQAQRPNSTLLTISTSRHLKRKKLNANPVSRSIWSPTAKFSPSLSIIILSGSMATSVVSPTSRIHHQLNTPTNEH